MSTFIVRVQLTHETTKNYALLSEILLKARFTDKIKNENGIEYWLPTGNYLIETPDGSAKAWVFQKIVMNATIDVVRRSGFDADKGPMVLITEAKKKGIFGLV
jgi:hypothetical protein